jgi:hypothetical protein
MVAQSALKISLCEIDAHGSGPMKFAKTLFCGSGALAAIDPRRPPPIAPGAGLPQRLGC